MMSSKSKNLWSTKAWLTSEDSHMSCVSCGVHSGHLIGECNLEGFGSSTP